MRGLVLGFTSPLGTRGALDVYMCLGCGGVDGVGGEWVGACTMVWSSGVVLCLCELGFIV